METYQLLEQEYGENFAALSALCSESLVSVGGSHQSIRAIKVNLKAAVSYPTHSHEA